MASMCCNTDYSFILQNIRSLRKNFDSFITNINAINIDFDFVFFTEIWITSSEIMDFKLEGFSLFAKCNDHYRSGGVAAFVRSSLNCQVSSLNFSSADAMKIHIQLGNMKLCFILIYRLHGYPFETFLIELSNFLETDNSRHKILLGDLNFDLMKNSQIKDDYLSLCASFGLESLMNGVTRPCSNTCIDHVFSETNCQQYTIDLNNLELFITDHNTIHGTLTFTDKRSRGRKYHRSIYHNKIDYSGFSEALCVSNWSAVFCSDDPNVAYSTFINIFNLNLNNFKSLVKIKRCNFKLKPWMSDSLLKLVNYRNKVAKQYNKTRNSAKLKEQLNSLNAKIKKSVPQTKELYFKNRFNAAKDLKSKWKVVNTVLSNNFSSDTIPSINISDNATLTQPKEIATAFNEHFTKIPYSILQDNHENNTINDPVNKNLVLSRCNNSNFFFFPITESEIVWAVSELKTSNSCGIDGISSLLIKYVIFDISHVLAYIFNICITKGVFPLNLKVGVVKPLFKKESRTDPNNYRPITLLNTFSKVFEKIMKSRLIKFLDKNNFLDKRQFGFIKNSSTEKALLSFLAPVHHCLNNNLKVSALFIDITKAFDTVNHNILLDKLSHIGIRGVALSLFKSYLQNRVQRVRINNIYSEEKIVNIGVPQGSVLGPLLFLIYCNSIFDLKLHGKSIAFADDMALLYSKPDIVSLKRDIKEDMRLLRLWFYVHDLVLSSKSKVMYFNVSGGIQDLDPFTFHSLACNGSNCDKLCVPIETVTTFKYLGINLDCQLNFKDHVAYLTKKLRQALRSFFYLRNICSIEFLKCLYYALIDSHLQYGITCWGGVYLTNIKPLITIQKGVLRIINFLPRISPSFPLFQMHKILPLRYLYVFKILKIYYLRSGNRLTSMYNSEPYLFRNQNRIKIPQPYKEHFKRFFSYTAPMIFAKLPPNIASIGTFREFCRCLKVWLFGIEDIENLFKTLK